MNLKTAIFIACTFAASVCLAGDFVRTIKFTRGASSATVEGSVVRGDRDIYIVHARAGQEISVSVVAFENNAAFSILPPGATEPIAGTEEEKDVRSWQGTLPTNGSYRIKVSGTRGNANYKLKISIK